MRNRTRSPIKEYRSVSASTSGRTFSTDLNRELAVGATLPAIVKSIQGFGGKIITYQEAGLPQKLMYSNWKNFGPRIGFAFRAFEGKKAFVARGGYRISYYTWPVATFIGNSGFSYPLAASFQNSVSNTALSPDGLPSYGLGASTAHLGRRRSIIDINGTGPNRALRRCSSSPDPRCRTGTSRSKKVCPRRRPDRICQPYGTFGSGCGQRLHAGLHLVASAKITAEVHQHGDPAIPTFWKHATRQTRPDCRTTTESSSSSSGAYKRFRLSVFFMAATLDRRPPPFRDNFCRGGADDINRAIAF